MRRLRWFIATFVGIPAALIPAILAVPAFAAELRLTVMGIRSDQGEILIGLYDNPDGFRSAIKHGATRGLLPDAGRLIGTAIRAQRGMQSTVFTQLPPARYGIIVIHDENDNGHIDENAAGIPTEGYGFGNDARGFLSAPAFDDASITIADTGVSTTITVIYPILSSSEDWSDLEEHDEPTAE